MNEFVLTFNEQDMNALTAAIGELPFKIAAPLVTKINQQIAMQQQATNGSGAPLPGEEPLREELIQ